jgi:hypothetical protein
VELFKNIFWFFNWIRLLCSFFIVKKNVRPDFSRKVRLPSKQKHKLYKPRVNWIAGFRMKGNVSRLVCIPSIESRSQEIPLPPAIQLWKSAIPFKSNLTLFLIPPLLHPWDSTYR